MNLTNKVYDILVIICEGVLPGLATLFIALAKIWSVPVLDLVAATCTAVAAFMAFVLKKSRDRYQERQKEREAFMETLKEEGVQ